METYSRTGNNYSVDTYKEFVLLSRSGLSKNEIFRRLKEKNPKLTIVPIDNWFDRFIPDLLPSEIQLKYQKIYNDFRKNGKNKHKHGCIIKWKEKACIKRSENDCYIRQ